MKTHPVICTLVKAVAVTSALLPGTAFAQVPVLAPSLIWHFDDIGKGTSLTATDSSGNNYTGTVENANVTGTGSYFTGFNGPGMRISTIGAFPSGTIDSASPWARDFTLGMLVQAPLRADAAADSVMFLARGGTASGGNQAWQLWLTPGEDNKVRLNFSVQSWSGSYETITSDWIEWNSSRQYQIFLSAAYEKSGHEWGVELYLTPVGSGNLTGVVSTTTTKMGSAGVPANNATDQGLVIGAAGYGYNQTHFPRGYLGADGKIFDVNLWLGTALGAEQLGTLLIIPEPASIVLFTGAIILGCTIARRRSRIRK